MHERPAEKCWAQPAAGDGFSWSADRPLVWEDFRGPVNSNATPETVATTAASLHWTFEYELMRSHRECSYRITNIDTSALFNPRESWVRPGYATPEVLEHEQGHFDLTQIHKMMLDRAARDLIGQERDCGRRASQADVEELVTKTVLPVRERLWQSLQRVQGQYDAETRHGISRDAQRDWTARIREALRRGRWN